MDSAAKITTERPPGGWFPAVLLALLCVIGISVDLAAPDPVEVNRIFDGATGALYIALEVLCSFPVRSAGVALAVLAALLVRPIQRVWFDRTGAPALAARSASGRLVPALAALAIVFGRSLDMSDSFDLVMGGISQSIKASLSFLGWLVLARVGWSYLVAAFDAMRERRCRAAAAARRTAEPAGRTPLLTRALAVLDRHPFAVPALALALAWSPCLVGYAPGLFMRDTATQILQWFGYPNNASDYLAPLKSGVYLNQHHPPASTALLGLFVGAGSALAGDENAGVFMFTMFQFALTVLAFAWGMFALKRLEVPVPARAGVLAFTVIVPVYSNYAVLVTKDVLFADALLVMAAALALLLCPWARRRSEDTALLVAGALGVALLRNGGWLVSVASLLVAAACVRGRKDVRHRRREASVVLATAILVLAVQIGLSGVVYPALGVAPGSVREALSIPFQQTARYVRDHAGDIPEGDLEAVDAVLDADAIGDLYRSHKSDPVKATFKEDATAADIMGYARVWLKEFADDPVCYLEATCANYYGYFYVGDSSSWTYTSDLSREVMAGDRLSEHFSFHQAENPVSRTLDGVCSAYRAFFQLAPVASLLLSAAFYDWALVFVAVGAWRHRLRWLAPLIALVTLVLSVALAGPCNASTYFRYAYPIAVVVPFLLALLTATEPDSKGGPEHAQG